MPIAEAEILIDAPIALIWQIMLDLPAYTSWNPFVVGIDSTSTPAVGGELRLHVRWRSGKQTTVTERITRLEAPDAAGRAQLDYAFGGPLSSLYLVRALRVQALETGTGGRTWYRTRERLWGLLAWATPMAAVRDGFARHAEALRAHAEALHATPRT